MDITTKIALQTLERTLEELRSINMMDPAVPIEVGKAAMRARMDVAFVVGMLSQQRKREEAA